MKFRTVFAIGLLSSAVHGADEPPLPIPVPTGVAPIPVADRPFTVPTPEVVRERKRILQEKTAELHRLQGEILKLGGEISSARKVRMTVRVVEVDADKLKDLKLVDPLDFMTKKAVNPLHTIVAFESDKELLQTLEPLVARECAEIVYSPTVITSLGETTVVNSFREFPEIDEAIAANKQLDLLNGSGRVPGMGIQLRATEDPDGDALRVSVNFRITEEDPANAVTLNGRTQNGTRSRRLQSTINVKSGATIVLGGLVTASARTKSRIRQIANDSAVPHADEQDITLHETRLYTLITAERLPVE